MILILLIGVSYALVAGVISPAIVNYRIANATPTPSPTVAPVTATPSPTVDPDEPTPSPTLEPGATPTPTVAPEGKLEGHVIGIDPSRGYSSKVRGVSTKIYANRLTYAVASLVRDKLENLGATVVFTLSDVKDDKTSSERATIFNNGSVEFALRIDCNYVNASETRGAMAWIPEDHDKKTQCEELASAVLNAYVDATDLPVREVGGESVIEKDSETLLNSTNAPVCTLFVGHISNVEDDNKVNDSDFQNTMANGIVEGILDYLGID
jgi:N-acetylmuramoyl-L-alanine amidase